ncbi:MAG: MinD/ParA family protein [Candidatus Aminicenantes bacterium]|nr:MinD/ParA family protein [Candidatus Aminicenantes bacterium]
MSPTAKVQREGEIWAVGGGKGGTGKTFLTSSLGSFLAKKGRKVVLVDMDIGGANLHSFFGIDRPQRSLTSFFEKGSSLQDILVRTDLDNLTLITGDIHSIASDTITFSQKLKLFRQILKINAQNVLIDLGAGSHLNTLDAFLIADKMVVVLVPEVIAIENMYHFIKNALFRKVKAVLKEYGFKEIVQHVWDRRQEFGIRNLKELIDHLKGSFSFIGTILDNELSRFRVALILNMVRNKQDIFLGTAVKSVLLKYLGVGIEYVGYVEYNDAVWRSVRERKPFMLNYTATAGAANIAAVGDNLLKGGEIVLPGGLG